MTTVAIISEYNPFHNGHKYQIDEIRRTFGDDTEIIAIMSGNYTQRGELAITDKTVRAKAAVLGGINLVLEIPFPFSITSAELYAKSGVAIADKIGVVDYLCFGSESGNVNELSRVAENMLSSTYKKSIKELKRDDSETGFAKICEAAYKNAFPNDTFEGLSLPNNILALEYIKALKATKSKIKPFAIKRIGAQYNQDMLVDGNIQSASAIRKLIASNIYSAREFVQDSTFFTLCEAKSNGLLPSDCEKISSAVISSLLLNSSEAQYNIHDTAGGLYNRLSGNAGRSTTISELVKLTETKHYTTARIRRSIWFSLFGVTSSEAKTLPLYSQVLALDSVGRGILKRIKKSGGFPILTKPSCIRMLDENALTQKRKSDNADFLYGLTLPKMRPAVDALKYTPFVK